MNSLRLDGKTALITGFGHGWLPELVVSFAEIGARVAVIDFNRGETNKAHELIDGKASLVLSGNINDSNNMNYLIHKAIKKLGNLDILINSFNLEESKPALYMTLKDWDRITHVNMRSVFLACRTAAPKLIESGNGSIVNIVSGMGEHGVMNASAYCASMGGTFGLIRSLALEWAGKGVRVNGIAVGWRMNQTKESMKDKMEILLYRYIPLERRCGPEDVIPMAILLSSDAASYMSGHIFFVDGGLNARS